MVLFFFWGFLGFFLPRAGERCSVFPILRGPSHRATQEGSKQLRRAHLEPVAVLGPKPPHHFIPGTFHPFCLHLSPTERSEAPNCTIQIIPNTVIRKKTLIKILIEIIRATNIPSLMYKSLIISSIKTEEFQPLNSLSWQTRTL